MVGDDAAFQEGSAMQHSVLPHRQVVSYYLFLGLLAPSLKSPVELPEEFSYDFEIAVCKSIAPDYGEDPFAYPTARYATTKIKDYRLRAGFDDLLENILPDIQESPELLFDRCGDYLRLRCTEAAIDINQSLSRHKEYQRISAAFPYRLAEFSQPHDPEEMLVRLGHLAPAPLVLKRTILFL